MKNKKKGFTLVEMIVVIALVAIFGAIVLSISVSSGKLFTMVQSNSVFNDEARVIISDIEDELRFARDIEESNATTATSISYKTNSYPISELSNIVLIYTVKEGGSTSTYAFTRGTISNKVIKYKLGSSGAKEVGITASNVSSFKVLKDASNKSYNLEIKFDNGKNSASYKSAITPRN